MSTRFRRLFVVLPLFSTLLAVIALLIGSPMPAGVRAEPQQVSPGASSRQIFLPIVAYTTDQAEPPRRDEPLVSLTASPASQVAAGELLRTTLTVRHDGPAPLTAFTVKLRFAFDQLIYEQSELDPKQALIIGFSGDNLDVFFRQVEPGVPVTVTVLFRVRDTVPDGTTIAVTPEYFCAAGLCRGNRVDVQVGDGAGLEDADDTSELAVSPPSGSLDTVFRFASRKFPYRDTVLLWVGSDAGVEQLPQSYPVGPDGVLRFELTGATLGVGNWNILAYGTLSGLSAIVNVTVTPTALAQVAESAPVAVVPAAPALPPVPASSAPAQIGTGGEGGVAGRVTAADTGQGLADVLVVVSPVGVVGSPVAATRTAADGSYLIATGLPGGAYTVQFRAASAGGAPNYRDATFPQPVVVTEPELTRDINAVLLRGSTISGRVTAADSGAGLAGVTVIARGSGGAVAGSAATDATGAYAVEGLAPGLYQLEFDAATGADGAIVAYAGTTLSDVALGAGATVTRNVALTLRSDVALIRGQVTGAAGGLPGVLVAFFDSENELVDLTLSGADGSYTSGPLAVGNYKVAFVTIFAQNPTTRQHVSAFFGGTRDAAGATPVEIGAPGIVRSAVNTTLALGGQISGRVQGLLAEPLPGVLVAAFDAAGDVRSVVRSDPTGSYELAGLPAGDYRIAYLTQYAPDEFVRGYLGSFYNGKPSIDAADPVSVTVGATTSGIDTVLTPGGVISGQVSGADSGAGLAGVVVLAFDANDALAGFTTTAADGSYQLPGLASGDYFVLFDTILAPNEASRGYIDEYFDDRRTEPFTPVTVTEGATATADAQLARGGQIAGRVTDIETGLGLSGVAVFLFSGGNVVSVTVTDESGAYTTAGLPAGSYTLVFDPTLSANQETEQYDAAALPTAVEVVVGTTTGGVDIALSLAPQ